MTDQEAVYIWVNRWQDFQTYTQKRGKPWAPPWVRLYTRILDDPAFLELTPETRSLLVGIWALFGRTRGTVTKDTRRLSRQLHQRVTKHQLDTLNHAGFLHFCSGTVREQLWNSFVNGSALELELEEEQEQTSIHPSVARPPEPTRDEPDDDVPFGPPKNGWMEGKIEGIDLENVLKEMPA